MNSSAACSTTENASDACDSLSWRTIDQPMPPTSMASVAMPTPRNAASSIAKPLRYQSRVSAALEMT